MSVTVTPGDIAEEIGREDPGLDSAEWKQWERWIARAYRAIQRRAVKVGVDYASLDAHDVGDVVIQVVSARATRPIDGAQSVTDQASADDVNASQTRRWRDDVASIEDALAEWWDSLGLSVATSEHWSGSVTYGCRR